MTKVTLLNSSLDVVKLNYSNLKWKNDELEEIMISLITAKNIAVTYKLKNEQKINSVDISLPKAKLDIFNENLIRVKYALSQPDAGNLESQIAEQFMIPTIRTIIDAAIEKSSPSITQKISTAGGSPYITKKSESKDAAQIAESKVSPLTHR